MFKISTNVDSIKKIDKHLKIVEFMKQMKTDLNFQKYIQEKCLETCEKIARQRVRGTTNDEYLDEYIKRNQIREFEEGFIMYNDFTIPAVLTTKSTRNTDRADGIVRNYEDGFNIALAFEYGVGIVGQENPKQGAWAYNINNYDENGWYYKTLNGTYLKTRGYEGAEVYRYTAIEIQNQLLKWVSDYYRRNLDGQL